MRLHRGIAGLHMGGEHEGDRRRVAVLPAAAFEGEAHGVGMRHVALQRLEDGRLQIGGAGVIEQTQQRGGDGAQVGAPLGGAQEQGLAGGA